MPPGGDFVSAHPKLTKAGDRLDNARMVAVTVVGIVIAAALGSIAFFVLLDGLGRLIQ